MSARRWYHPIVILNRLGSESTLAETHRCYATRVATDGPKATLLVESTMRLHTHPAKLSSMPTANEYTHRRFLPDASRPLCQKRDSRGQAQNSRWLGHTRNNLWSMDPFRCQSATLKTGATSGLINSCGVFVHDLVAFLLDPDVELFARRKIFPIENIPVNDFLR